MSLLSPALIPGEGRATSDAAVVQDNASRISPSADMCRDAAKHPLVRTLILSQSCSADEGSYRESRLCGTGGNRA